MSLPAPVLDLAASVVPDAEDLGKLAFAYAHGAPLSGFGDPDEIGLVCVWDQPEIPAAAPTEATHVTQSWFDGLVTTVTSGEGWSQPPTAALTDIAAFAYGVLLSDDAGAGTAARGTVSEFPTLLATRSAKALTEDLTTVPAALSNDTDPWTRAETLTTALYRAYVAWFAAHGHYFPGPARRHEYATHFGMDEVIPKAEQNLWKTLDPTHQSDRYTEFAQLILNDQ
ncbi:hypothetical protein [Stackebrandtia nassauensis]|uniref:Uncharacterized protein n=1 Tax=Stackebrandtia nassauensis (strain DSM 44728 / CIP 108903 / NRRL B-16338 / NBRC 102104 / LLR-40K-21) TaxID=446470 RepID=D3Q4C7_STANL|nr:hypothetical protein [Stackebrandtia nassauensis]ADD40087.1 hypothetical protein Snas_0370 [Stackebrandtia nassauensis DSM 44728]